MSLDSARSDYSDPLDAPPPSAAAPLAPPAGRSARALAVVGGLVALVVVLTATFGTALLALLGMSIAWAIARRRKRVLTRGASWWGASLGVAVGFAGFMAVTAASAPPGTLAKITQTNDSLAAVSPKAEPPEWLKRIDPNAGQSSPLADSTTARLGRSPAFLLWIGAMSTMLVSIVLGGIVGTLGWGVGLLLVFGATGRWVPRVRVRETASWPSVEA